MSLDELMQAAADGSKESAASFYKEFLKEKIFVVDRYQNAPLSDSPKYPNDFFNILGLQATKRVYVPVFSNPNYIQEWAGTDLKFREISTKELLKLLPSDWWLIFNPGQEVEKEISAWEINLLKQGEESVQEIIAEIFHEDEVELELEPLKGSDYPQLRINLSTFAQNNSNIKKIVIVKQPKANHTLLSSYNIIVGIYIKNEDKSLKSVIQQIIDECQIGNDPGKVILVTKKNELNYNFFDKFQSIYQAKTTVFSGNFFTNLFKK